MRLRAVACRVNQVAGQRVVKLLHVSGGAGMAQVSSTALAAASNIRVTARVMTRCGATPPPPVVTP